MKKKAKDKAKAKVAKAKTAIRETIARYAEGLRDGNAKKLEQAFIKRAQFLYAYVDQNWKPTPAQKKAFRCRIRSLTVSGKMAVALLTEKHSMGDDYLTSLQLLKYRGSWRIVSKLFAVT